MSERVGWKEIVRGPTETEGRVSDGEERDLGPGTYSTLFVPMSVQFPSPSDPIHRPDFVHLSLVGV